MLGVAAQRIVRTIRKPRNNADEAIAPKPGGTGLSGRFAVSRRSPMGACHGLRVASCISSRKASVATTWDLFRGSFARRSRTRHPAAGTVTFAWRSSPTDLCVTGRECPPPAGRMARDGTPERPRPSDALQEFLMKKPVRVTVTGAAGQIGYSLLFRIASGEMLGEDQPLILQLLELPLDKAQAALKGVMMEVEDCAFPLLAGMSGGSDPMAAFKDAEIALLA